MENEIKWLTPQEAADRIGISISTFYRYMNFGSDPIPTYRIGDKIVKIKQDELDAWVIAHKKL